MCFPLFKSRSKFLILQKYKLVENSPPMNVLQLHLIWKWIYLQSVYVGNQMLFKNLQILINIKLISNKLPTNSPCV